MKQHGKGGSRAVCLLAAVCALLVLTGCGAGQRGMEPLKTTLLKVGKADAIVLQAGAETMVIDAGEEEDGEELAEFLKRRDISRVDFLVITHFDRDHVGGADTLVETMEVGRVLLPAYEGSGSEYTDFMEALKRKKLTPSRLTEPESFSLGEASVLVEPPGSYEAGVGEVDNNFSLITTVVHGDNRLLFTGDAEKKRLREWLSGDSAGPCDFLKVPHHGVYNGALEELFDTAAPKFAVICSSEKNPAQDKTLELLKQRGIETFQTKDGDVDVISDGARLELRQDRDH